MCRSCSQVPLVIRTARGTQVEKVALGAANGALYFHLRRGSRAPFHQHRSGVRRLPQARSARAPPSIGQIFGEPKILAVLPAKASPGSQKAYRDLVDGWRSDNHAIEVKLDTEITALPADRAVWLLGRENRFAADLFGKVLKAGATEIRVDGESMPLAGHTVVLTERHPTNVEKAVGWIFSEPFAAMPGLGRKLPHYGKYSYLGFSGEEPVNVLKGQWSASDSPLHVHLCATTSRRGHPAHGPQGAPGSGRTASRLLPEVADGTRVVPGLAEARRPGSGERGDHRGG